MLVEGFAVVGSDININADDFAGGLPRIQPFHYIQKAEHGSGQNKRTAVGDAGFKDQIRLYLRNDFLKSNNILWILNNWSFKPVKAIRVFCFNGCLEKLSGYLANRFVVGIDFNNSCPLVFDFHWSSVVDVVMDLCYKGASRISCNYSSGCDIFGDHSAGADS
ncbi:hypothetical protein IFHNHDMJ_02152 [Synechococcus sp. CBW1107]|nr:hypothetical protein IFHNHDMJ_02152 [Synechococcus sp. CBW1107]